MRTPSPGPEQQREEKGSFSIQQSLQDMWHGLSFLFSRTETSGQHSQSRDQRLYESWRELVEFRQSLSSDYLGSLPIDEARARVEQLTLKTQAYDQLLQEQYQAFRSVLGRNFLGPVEWRLGFGVDVGRPPPIPEYITEKLLSSRCPLHPGKRIKDTHILLLMPKTVDGEPYTPLTLDRLCSSRTGSGGVLINPACENWKSAAWASKPQERIEWVLIPTGDPRQDEVHTSRHFRDKDVSEQEQVLADRYSQDYREARLVEVITAALLNDVVNGEPRMLKGYGNWLRCAETGAAGGRVCVGDFSFGGLWTHIGLRPSGAHDQSYCDGRWPAVGFALARKPKA